MIIPPWPWLVGAFAGGVMVGAATGATVQGWLMSAEIAAANKKSAQCESGRADANAAGATADREVADEIDPLVRAQSTRILNLERELERAREEVENAPRDSCLADDADARRMRRIGDAADPDYSDQPGGRR